MQFRNEYYFLSNMYPCTIEYNGKKYPCVETAFQAQKSSDVDFIRNGCFVDGFTAKKIGRHVKLRSDWQNVKIDIMKDIIRAKFHNEQLRKMLLATGNKELVEDNSWGDYFWGRCNGVGENMLGKILMLIRSELRC